jgi:hypothetical protein
MAYGVCKVKNISGDSGTWQDRVLANNEIYTIPDNERIAWANDDEVIDSIAVDGLQIGDATEWLETHAAQIAHLQDY